MVFLKEDKILIKSYKIWRVTKSYSPCCLDQLTERFSMSIMVLIGISKLGCTGIILSSRVSKWRGILSWQPSCPEATAAHVPVGSGWIFYVWTGQHPTGHQARNTFAFLERHRTSFLQHCGHWICWTLTWSTTASGVCCRRKLPLQDNCPGGQTCLINKWAQLDQSINHWCHCWPVAPSSMCLCQCTQGTFRA